MRAQNGAYVPNVDRLRLRLMKAPYDYATKQQTYKAPYDYVDLVVVPV